MKKKSFLDNFYNDISKISIAINKKEIEKLVISIKKIKINKGRIFFLGIGGSAGNCSHAVNDFRKICGIECYTPLDNISELTARINDDGWNSSLTNWLKISNLNYKDAIFIFSVGGGDLKRNISDNLIHAVKYAKKKRAKIFGVIGRKKSFVNLNGHNIIVVPEANKKYITAYSEAFQAVIWHSIVSHPILQSSKTKW